MCFELINLPLSKNYIRYVFNRILETRFFETSTNWFIFYLYIDIFKYTFILHLKKSTADGILC